jgi:hypothetical protein
MLSRQLSELKAKILKLHRIGKPAPRRAVKNTMPGSFIVSDLQMVEEAERREAARRAQSSKGKGRDSALAAAAVTARTGPMEAVWIKDVFGAFERVVYTQTAAAAATSGSGTGSKSETETEE